MEAVYSMIGFVYSITLCLFIDAIVFLCVDRICKILLQDCQNLSQKRNIWLVEALVLYGAAAINSYHHRPVLLLTLATLTFCSATITRWIDFNSYWEWVLTYWSEFKDQEESMQEQPSFLSGMQPPQEYKNQVSNDQYRDYLRQSEKVNIAANVNSGISAAPGVGLKTLRFNEQTASYEYVGTRKLQPQDATIGLRRRALHNSIVTHADPVETNQSSVMQNLEGFGNRVWSALGLPSKTNLPPGLPNPGQNLCFMNSVLQCLSRASNLPDELSEDAKSCSSQFVLLDTICEVMQQLNVMPCENTTPLIDTAQLRTAGAEINRALLCPVSAHQTQQDACEFLSWLLIELHNAVKETKNGIWTDGMDDSLTKLNTVYGNISETYSSVMKDECRTEIANAKGISDPEISEPLQNLANLEWISHKRANSSVIDDMFTSQCIEVQMCTNCMFTTATVQTMNIMAIPLPSADTKPVTLQSCLEHFSAKEKLSGKDGLQCDRCQSAINGKMNTPATNLRTRSTSRLSTEFKTIPVSPISTPSASVSQPNNFLASTPLPGTGVVSPVSRASAGRVITDGIRQCLMRRLAECVTIQLMRFSYNPFTKRVFKLRTPAVIPISNLDLTPLTFDAKVKRQDMTGIAAQNLYNLYGVCLHLGGDSAANGHYIAYCMAADGKWYKFDDEHVTAVRRMDQELESRRFQENCYVLFYRKRHEQATKTGTTATQ